MAKINQPNEDIDLLDFIFMLWANKFIIIGSAFIASIIGGVFIFISNMSVPDQPRIYESEIKYNVDLMPPRYKSLRFVTNEVNRRMIISNFQNLFFSKEIFMSWKNNNPESNLNYDDFDISMNFEGVVVLKEENNRLAMFKTSKREDYEYISVKVTELEILNEVYSFAQYVADKLTSQHILLSQDEKKLLFKKNQMIEEGFRDFYNRNIDRLSFENAEIILELGNYFSDQMEISNYIEAIDKYILAVNKGRKAIDIQLPTMPIGINNINSKFPLLSIVVFGFLGAIIAAFYIILMNSIRRRNENLAKT